MKKLPTVKNRESKIYTDSDVIKRIQDFQSEATDCGNLTIAILNTEGDSVKVNAVIEKWYKEKYDGKNNKTNV